jgi:hypothetical protein
MIHPLVETRYGSPYYAHDAKRYPYYELVPKGIDENLEFRERIIALGMESEKFATEQREMCKRDLLYYVNTYIWTLDPRDDIEPRRPFITFPKQDELITELEKAVREKRDIIVPKCRDIGATWCGLIAMDGMFRFRKHLNFLVVSRNADLVDSTENPDCLMSKLDFIEERLPHWLALGKGVYLNRTKFHFFNRITKSTINGEATTANIGRGGRPTAILLDEYAAFDPVQAAEVLEATQKATDSRWFVSTPKGIGNAFSEMNDLSELPNTPIRRVVVHWTHWQKMAKGSYTWSRDGELVLLDKSYSYPLDFEFIRDRPGKQRSPYYDNECLRTPVASLIAQELDIDFVGSGRPFFDPAEIKDQKERFVRNPVRTGELSYDDMSGRPTGWRDLPGGRFKLWCQLDERGLPPLDRTYGSGVDVSEGAGVSNSVIAVGDVRTGEKVLEFADPDMRPEQLAYLACAIGKWFKGLDGLPALTIWEANGPGSAFGNKLIDLSYTNLWYRPRNPNDIAKKRSTVPGWPSTKDGKRVLFGEFARACHRGEFLDRSAEAMKERAYYKFGQSGRLEWMGGGGRDPSGASDIHGDRVMAGVVLWHCMRTMPATEAIQYKAPENTPKARRDKWEARRKKEKSADGDVLFCVADSGMDW